MSSRLPPYFGQTKSIITLLTRGPPALASMSITYTEQLARMTCVAVMLHILVETAKIWGGASRCIVRMKSLHEFRGKILAFLHIHHLLC